MQGPFFLKSMKLVSTLRWFVYRSFLARSFSSLEQSLSWGFEHVDDPLACLLVPGSAYVIHRLSLVEEELLRVVTVALSVVLPSRVWQHESSHRAGLVLGSTYTVTMPYRVVFSLDLTRS